MTLTQMIEDTRRRSRVHSMEAADGVLIVYLNQAIDRFSAEVDGYPAQANLSLAAHPIPLPADFQGLRELRWDNFRLPQVASVGEVTQVGGPWRYAIQGDAIHLDPRPADGSGTCALYYTARFAKFLEDGSHLGTEEPDVPEQWHPILPYYAAAQLAENRFEHDVANRLLALFWNGVKEYRAERPENTAIFSTVETHLAPGMLL